MKKMFRRFVVLSLAVILSVSVLSGCNIDDGEEIDDTKTQLNVNYHYAGLGTEWLLEYKKAFEEFYADVSFEEGKMGVQVVPVPNYSSGLGGVGAVVTEHTDVIWSEGLKYYDLVSAGYAYNISDIMDSTLSEYGDNRSIEDKLDDSMLEYLKSYDGEVYALPYYDGFSGIIYDLDLFENDTYGGFYFAESGGFTTGKAGAPAKAKGPDNVANTYDDGLPQTVNQFFDMLDQMVSKSVVPFMWAGANPYADRLTRAMWVNFEGKEQMDLNFNFSGTAKDLVSIDGNGNITPLPDEEINNNNAYKLFSQEGRYRALQFAERLARNASYYSKYAFGTQTHLTAQEDFIYGSISPSKETCAMLVDGVWWDEEASDVFRSIEESFANGERYSRKNRRFAFMPLPHYDEATVGNKNTMVSSAYSLVIINKKIQPHKLDLAKKFLRFTSTDAMLQKFTETINVPRPFNYEISNEKVSNMTTFAQSVYNLRKNSDIVYPHSGNRFWLNTRLDFTSLSFGNAVVSGATYTNPIYSFKGTASLTPEKYFNALVDKHAGGWQSFIDSYAKL